jgi:hypothetical protein
MLQMERQDGSSSFVWKAGGVPRLNFALQTGVNADALGNYGVLKFSGEWDSGEPLMEFESVGTNAILLQSEPSPADTNARFNISANGVLQWGSGSSGLDTDLYRSSAGTLETENNIIVNGNLSVAGTKAAVVDTASYGKRELYAVESPEGWFEDFGSAELVDGRSAVNIEPIFAQTVNTQREYHVFLTAMGRCALYVSQKRRCCLR